MHIDSTYPELRFFKLIRINVYSFYIQFIFTVLYNLKNFPCLKIKINFKMRDNAFVIFVYIITVWKRSIPLKKVKRFKSIIQ